MKLAKKSYSKGGSIKAGGSITAGGSIKAGGKIRRRRRGEKLRKGGLFRAKSKQNSRDFSENVFEAGMSAMAIPGAQLFALTAMSGSAIGSGVVELLDYIF